MSRRVSEKQQKELAAAVARLSRLQRAEAFDPIDSASRPTPQQQAVLDDLGRVKYRWVIAGNQSGKTLTAAREISWIWTETHPKWTRPENWGAEPLLLLVVGRTTKQIEEVLWRKIAAFVDPAEVKLQRQGGIIQKAIHEPTGNAIIFASHHSDAEAREKLQAYVAHYVAIDEMPGSAKLLEELQRRVQARDGYFLATFTPKVSNHTIRKMVDMGREPLAKKYRLHMLSNPIYKGREQELLDSISSFSDNYKKTILEGEWLTEEENVYHLDWDTMIRAPHGYDPSWRHVESVDPALSSALGFTIWAEDPATAIWYCIRSEHITGIADPQVMVQACQERTRNMNIVRRVTDYAPWFTGTAARLGVLPPYVGVYSKNTRKGELIKGFQEKLGVRIMIAPWCETLISEIQDCRWSDRGEGKIVNQHIYHCTDSAQYFADCMPSPGARPISVPIHQHIYETHQKRKMAELTKQTREERRQDSKLEKFKVRRGGRVW
jgi:hypothetical protein